MARKLLLALLCLPVVLILSVVLYLKLADLSGWSGVVESTVAKAIGRELTIAGRFGLDVGSVTRLVAEDVTLANAEWSAAPAMAHVDRVEINLDLWSLVLHPIRIHGVEIQGARLLLEEDAEGRDNWNFGSKCLLRRSGHPA